MRRVNHQAAQTPRPPRSTRCVCHGHAPSCKAAKSADAIPAGIAAVRFIGVVCTVVYHRWKRTSRTTGPQRNRTTESPRRTGWSFLARSLRLFQGDMRRCTTEQRSDEQEKPAGRLMGVMVVSFTPHWSWVCHVGVAWTWLCPMKWSRVRVVPSVARVQAP